MAWRTEAAALHRQAGFALMVAAVLAAGCSTISDRKPAPVVQAKPSVPGADRGTSGTAPTTRSARGGAYYQDDGPGDSPPANLAAIPDAVPKPEPLHPWANRPYTVLGRDYVPRVDISSLRERGMASWYGRKFHGKPTSSGERYDMYGMTAAHPTLPIPSYVRVTNPRNGRSVVVRVNDRGPFLNQRVIDLSYTAAWKLGFVEAGSTEVVVDLLMPPTLASQSSSTAVRADVASVEDPPLLIPSLPLPMLADAAREELERDALESAAHALPMLSRP